MGKNVSRRLFIDQYCFGILNHLLTNDDFKSKNLSANNITVIDGNEKDLNFISKVNEEVFFYIVKPEKMIFNVIIQIHLMLKGMKENSIHNIIFIPCENYDIVDFMVINHIKSDFNVENLYFDLIPIDIDLLSLERDNCIKEIYIDNNLTCVGDLANSLVKLETIFGKIKYKYIKGDIAETFCKMVEEKEKENDLITNDEILGMIVLDRSVDFITLMATNYTCEGLIDDSIGINLGRIKVKESLLKENLSKNKISSEKMVSYGLTTTYNPFYCSFRCMHYLDGIKYIRKIREYYQNLASKSKDKNISLGKLREFTEELNYYMTKIKENLIMNENILNYITQPLTDPNYIKYIEKEQIMLSGELPDNLHNYYDEYLCEQKDLNSLIRLMILESLTQNGIKDYQKLKREILNIYGHEKIFLFNDLEKLDWMKEKQILKNIKKNMTTITYNQIIEKLELIKMNNEPTKIDDCSYVLGGYCPLSLRLIEKAIEGKWGKTIEIIKRIPGSTYNPDDETVISNPEKDTNIIFIIFVGGITYTEIEGIRYLNRKYDEENKQGKRKKTQFIILTTGILNSKKIFGTLGKNIHSVLSIKSFYEQVKDK